jgi:hypothetical protein
MIEPKHRRLSVRRQCELIALPRSSYYREPKSETEENLELMSLIVLPIAGQVTPNFLIWMYAKEIPGYIRIRGF